MENRADGFDAYHNPIGHAFDLGGGDEDRVRGEKILLYVGYLGEEPRTMFRESLHLKKVISERGLQLDVRLAPGNQHCDLDESVLSGYAQLWYLSDAKRTLSSQQVEMIARYVRDGNGLAIWADNDPYYADANLLAQELMGSGFSGNTKGGQVMVPGPDVAPGHFIDHQLTQGVNNLYEGITICTIEPAPGIAILGQSHDGQLCLGCFEDERLRIVLDTGFTKLFADLFQRSAGISRYLSNIAFWLAHGSRGIEYTLLTPNRESTATIGPFTTSEGYRVALDQPAALTYILQWNGSATLGLTVRDPQGEAVYLDTSSTSPWRITVPGAMPGEWMCYVSGVEVPALDFPYVLTVVLDR